MSMNVNGVGNQQVYSQQGASTANRKEAKAAEEAVVYEAGSATERKATYSINRQSESDRAAMVEQMKQELLSRQNQLSSIVVQMLTGQANATNLSEMFTPDKLKNVSAADIAQAKEDISEDGYWGVKQTSQRLFDFASALAGDDVEKMKEMQAAMEKGFKQATKAWGQDLPGICSETIEAANKMFDDYYASKGA